MILARIHIGGCVLRSVRHRLDAEYGLYRIGIQRETRRRIESCHTHHPTRYPLSPPPSRSANAALSRSRPTSSTYGTSAVGSTRPTASRSRPSTSRRRTCGSSSSTCASPEDCNPRRSTGSSRACDRSSDGRGPRDAWGIAHLPSSPAIGCSTLRQAGQVLSRDLAGRGGVKVLPFVETTGWRYHRFAGGRGEDAPGRSGSWPRPLRSPSVVGDLVPKARFASRRGVERFRVPARCDRPGRERLHRYHPLTFRTAEDR